MYKRFIIAPLLLLNSLQTFAQSKDSVTLSLQECIETAITNNLSVKQSDLAMQRSHIGYNQSKTNLLPNISGSINQGLNKGRSIDPFTNAYINQELNYTNYSLGGNLVLFNGFALLNSIRQNLYAFQASKMDFQQQKDEIAINVMLAYLQILNNEELLKQAYNRVNLSRKQVAQAEISNQEGNIPPSQLSDLKGSLSNDELAVIGSENALNNAKISLAQYMNMPYNANLHVEQLNAEQVASLSQNGPDEIYAISLQTLASVKASSLRTKSAEIGIKMARASLYPSISLNANLFTNYSNAATRNVFTDSATVRTNGYVDINGQRNYVMTNQNNYRQEKISYSDQFKNNYSSGFSVGLQLPIFSGWYNRNKIALAKIDLKSAQYVEETTKNRLKQSIDQAYLDVQSSAQRYKTLQKQVEAYTQSFKAAEAKFNAGVGTVIEYSFAKNNLDGTNINLITERYNYILRVKILDYYQGKQLW